MKKIFLFTASLLLAGSMMAAVPVDLSDGQELAEEGATSVVNYSSSVCTATITTPAAWVAAGVEFYLEEAIDASDIESVKGYVMCDTTSQYMELAIYVRDANGHRWWSGTALSPAGLSDWTTFEEVPSVSYWDGQDPGDYPEQEITSVGVFLSPGVAITDYKVSVKNLYIFTKSSGLKTVKVADKASKAIVNGQLLILRNGAVYNALGTNL